MKTITFLNEKGGVGKTTLAQTLACAMARDGFRVLLVDADPQATATVGLGLEREPNFYDLIQRKGAWGKLIRRVETARIAPEEQVKGELFLLPGDRETRNLNVEKSTLLLQRLGELEGRIDWVIIDTAPSASLMHILIYMATDYIVYPTLLAYYSLEGLKQSLEVLRDYTMLRQSQGREAIELLGIAPTMTSLRTNEHRANLIEVGNIELPTFDPIPHSTNWEAATATQHSIFAFDPNATSAKYAQRFVNQAYRQLGLVQA